MTDNAVMKMKYSKSLIVTIVGLVVVGGYLLHRWDEHSRAPEMHVSPAQSGAYEYVHRHQSDVPTVTTNSPTPPPSSNQAPHAD